ncbi:hypothetical protein DRH29_00900 [candidate division Kazan bacterium]|uniref:R3H domain-containing protein n=1 Tax=candidate division Kazan bacterium TaxID=2202143 RepID=A0A420ZDM1_UNCK3|nr:MAG: hypothetical protein DRH29_00900 [candidate division Kazan bacterium]
MNQKIKTSIEKHLKEIFSFFDLAPRIVTALDDKTIVVDVTTERDDLFISHHADPLLALQHLLRLILRRNFPDDAINLSLNIGGFHQQQRSRLASIAHNAANQVRETGTAVYMKPMSSFERRLIHLSLVEEEGVKSESTGIGAGRRVVVKPDKS